MKFRGLLSRTVLTTGLALVGGSFGPAVAAEVYDVDPVHSMVVFRVNHLGLSNSFGRFNDLSGTFTLNDEDPALSKVVFEIKAESVDTNFEQRDNHLRSRDFFDAKQFPVISFRSTEVAKSGSSGYEVSGDLSLHGVTRPLKVTIEEVGRGKDPRGSHRAGFGAEFTIKRSDFGMNYMLPGIGDEVQIFLTVEGIRK